MSIQKIKLDRNIDELWNGCILASVAHAIMVAHYPSIANENSWDGINYSVQDSQGARGTITFYKDFCVGAFRNEYSSRLTTKFKDANEYFQGAPQEVVQSANSEALQYLLDDIQEQIVPVITTAFWGNNRELWTIDSSKEFFENGGFLIERQLMSFDTAISEWIEDYEMSEQQVDLLKSIYSRKISNSKDKIILSAKEISMIGVFDEEGLIASKESFREMGIGWEE